ncbi:MAG: hypothetical protein R2799_00070 [Crocinitomicaceae bacterium]
MKIWSFWKSFVILQNQTENADGNGLWLDLRSLIDYVEYMRYQETDRTFSLKGRTFISLIRLMNEWHEEQDFASLEKYLRSEWSTL